MLTGAPHCSCEQCQRLRSFKGDHIEKPVADSKKGALVIKIGFWVYCTIMIVRSPQNHSLIIKAPIVVTCLPETVQAAGKVERGKEAHPLCLRDRTEDSAMGSWPRGGA